MFTLLLIFSYLVGGIPFGLLLARAFADVDIRVHGSGNIGATNVNRVLGRKLGAATLLCDMLKGVVPVVLAMIFLPSYADAAWVGLVAFLGHCFSIYLKFHGGKGVATAFGVILPLAPLVAFVALIAWVLVVRFSRISALGALAASATVPFASFYFVGDWTIVGLFTLMVVILIARHKENIQRLREGKELSLKN